MASNPPNVDVAIDTAASLQECGSEGGPSVARAESEEDAEVEMGGINIARTEKKVEGKKGRVGGVEDSIIQDVGQRTVHLVSVTSLTLKPVSPTWPKKPRIESTTKRTRTRSRSMARETM